MIAGTISKSGKNKIFKQAQQLMRLQGYYSTSIADIAGNCDLSKASLYHHISEKKDLVGIAVRDVEQFFKEDCFDLIYDDKLSSDKKVDLLFITIRRYLAEYQGGCLVHNLVHEMVDSEPEFLELFQSYFTRWLDAITHIFKGPHSLEVARPLAQDMVAQLGGAIMMDRLYRTTQYVTRIQALMTYYVTKKALA